MQTRYSYYAIFESDGAPDPDKDVIIRFPDVPNAFSCGDNFADGERMARECLALHFLCYLERGLPFPLSSAPEQLQHAANESLHLIEGDVRNYFPSELAELEKPRKRGGARKGAGRPKKAEEERATAPVWVYLNKEERAALEKLAEASGKTKSAYLRDYIVSEYQKLS